MTVTTAFAIVNWQGIDWTELNTVAVVDGNLVVTNDASDIPSAHHNTPDPFRASAVQSITFSFIDEGPGTVGGGILVEDEDAAALTTFGVVPGQTEYQIVLFIGGSTTISTGVTRTAGEHTFQLAKLADDSIVYVLDGLVVYTTPGFGMQKFGDVYLRARGGVHRRLRYLHVLRRRDVLSTRPSLRTSTSPGSSAIANLSRASQPWPGSARRSLQRYRNLLGIPRRTGTLAFLIRNEAAESLETGNVAVVSVYAFRLGGYFAEPIKIAGGSCDAPFVPFDPSVVTADPLTTLAGGPWVAWFTVEICDSGPIS